MANYRGFSTLSSKKKFILTDYELVKQDLINYFNIRKGSKLMQPDFGTIIWDQLFEPLTDEVQQTVADDIKRIVGYDPRLSVGQIVVVQKEMGLLVQLTLSYVPTGQLDTLELNFGKSAQAVALTTV